jgi:flavin reductase (DIM6/NTAB) family NADH-FMN oxidoreductase RutF
MLIRPKGHRGITMSERSLERVLGRIPSGIFILTAGTGDRATGMLASWVQQAGFAPPSITIAVQRDRYVCDWLTEGRPFVVNMLGDGQKEYLAHFGRGFKPGEAAFEGLPITYCARGVPILKDALGHLECERQEHIDSGDHRIFLAKVVRGRLAEDSSPMVHIRKSGSHY